MQFRWVLRLGSRWVSPRTSIEIQSMFCKNLVQILHTRHNETSLMKYALIDVMLLTLATGVEHWCDRRASSSLRCQGPSQFSLDTNSEQGLARIGRLSVSTTFDTRSSSAQLTHSVELKVGVPHLCCDNRGPNTLYALDAVYAAYAIILPMVCYLLTWRRSKSHLNMQIIEREPPQKGSQYSYVVIDHRGAASGLPIAIPPSASRTPQFGHSSAQRHRLIKLHQTPSEH